MLAITALVASLAGVASAEHTASCNGEITEVATPAGTLYVDDRGVDAEGVWIYEESNGEAGLQSGGQSAILGDLDEDTCEAVGHPDPDTLLF